MRKPPSAMVTIAIGSESDRRAVAPALGGAEVWAAVGELPDDLARAEGEARPLGAGELVAPRFEAGRRVRREVILRPHGTVALVHPPARRIDGGLRVLPEVDDAREDLHVALRLH